MRAPARRCRHWRGRRGRGLTRRGGRGRRSPSTGSAARLPGRLWARSRAGGRLGCRRLRGRGSSRFRSGGGGSRRARGSRFGCSRGLGRRSRGRRFAGGLFLCRRFLGWRATSLGASLLVTPSSPTGGAHERQDEDHADRKSVRPSDSQGLSQFQICRRHPLPRSLASSQCDHGGLAKNCMRRTPEHRRNAVKTILPRADGAANRGRYGFAPTWKLRRSGSVVPAAGGRLGTDNVEQRRTREAQQSPQHRGPPADQVVTEAAVASCSRRVNPARS